MGIRIAIDTGGTFTDVVAIDTRTGSRSAIKTPSTPIDPSVALLDGVEKVLTAAGLDAGDVELLLHGSTVATNAVLEHKFNGLGLIVTRGFRHMIEIARQSVPDGYGNSFFWVKPQRLVPLRMVREVPGRMRFDGSELEPLDEAEALKAIGELVEDGVRCVGVCLLHSYANAAHEERLGALIAEHYPQVHVSLSSFVLPEYREYERAMTTLIDVMVKPFCQTYLASAEEKVRRITGPIPFLIMQSNGGMATQKMAGEKPVTMLLSGPAGGVLGSIHMAGLAGYRDILTIDVGGTSTDVALIEDLTPRYTSESMVEHYPVKTPMLDIVTIGSGGGSIVWIDDYGNLKVGPQSAGSDPGPICYGRGGQKATVTDAAVALGRLPRAFIGGALKLDADSAIAAFDALGKRFGLPPEEVAAGAIEIAAANQVFGLRQVTTVRGREPADYTMVAFGGAGGLFAADVADFLSIRTIVSPPDPGNLCAFGLHVSDVRRDYIRTMVRRQSDCDAAEILSMWDRLIEEGVAELTAEGIGRDAIELRRVADVRYFGEGYEVQVNVPADISGQAAVDHVFSQFHEVHEGMFGFNYQGEQDVEIVNLRLQAIGRQERPRIEPIAARPEAAEAEGIRPVYWRKSGWVDCPIYRRGSLSLEQSVIGPAIIEEYGSTVVVPPGWTAQTEPYGSLILTHNVIREALS